MKCCLSYMAAPHTYTREDVVEVNCHSGYAVLNRILELVLLAGARLAEPGEFTRRAFLNGRLDLSQAEAVHRAYSLPIRTESPDRQSHSCREDLSQAIQAWREGILDLQAELEACY